MLRHAGALAKVSLSLAFCALSHPIEVFASISANFDFAVPVMVSSKTTIEVQESIPVLKLKTQANQQMKFEMQGLGDVEDPTSSRLPADVRVTLKDLFMHLNVNGKELIFDPRGDKVSVPLNHLSQLIDRPLNLRIDPQGHLTDGTDTFASIFRELPALKQLSFQNILSDHLHHLFTLYGRELMIGDTIQIQGAADSVIGPSPTMTYEIIAIDDDEIKAIVKGKLSPAVSTFTIKGEAGAEPATVKMYLTGDVSGKASWNRRNALLSTLDKEYRYQAKMGMGDTEWMMLMTMNNVINVSPPAAAPKRYAK